MKALEILGGGMMAIGYISFSILGLIIHVWTIVIAYHISGLISACITVVFPVFAQIYWFIEVGRNVGFGSIYCLAIITYVVLIGIGILGLIIFGIAEGRTKDY